MTPFGIFPRGKQGVAAMAAAPSRMIVMGVVLVSGSAIAQDIDHVLWQERLLILISPSADEPLLVRQKQALRDRHDAVAERRLRIIEAYADHDSIAAQDHSPPLHRAIRERFGAAHDTREMILIGLDGGIKRRAPLSTPLGEIFQQIDGMPMRRLEIEGRQRNGLPVTRP